MEKQMLEVLMGLQAKINKLDFNQMLELLVDQIIKTLRIERCSIFRISANLEKAYLVAGKPKNGHGLGMHFSLDGLKALKEMVETKNYVLIKEPWQDERTLETRELIYHKKINAILFVPLAIQDEITGAIVVDAAGDKKNFSQEEVDFCLSVANIVSLLLERDQMQKEKAEKETLVILGQAAAEAAHRIRNPLALIGGWARRLTTLGDFLRQSQVQDLVGYSEYPSIIVEEVGKLEATVNALLNFSRPKRIKVVEIDVNEILRGAERLITELGGKKGIKARFQLDDLPKIFGDPVEIEDVFSAIIRNAVEAIKDAGEIWIKSKKEGDWIKISVTNSGGCISREILQEIFNPFFTTKPDGTGLGLAIAERTIRDYGGEIKVENDETLKLTTFVVKIPISSQRRRNDVLREMGYHD